MKEFFREYLYIYHYVLPLTLHSFITCPSLFSLKPFHSFTSHFKVNFLPLKTVSWILLEFNICLQYFFLFWGKIYTMKCKIPQIYLLNFDKCICLYNSKLYQDIDPCHHSRKFLHVYYQLILTYAPPEPTTVVMFCFSM